MTQWKQSMWITHGETKYMPGEGSGSGSAVVVLTLTLTPARAVVVLALTLTPARAVVVLTLTLTRARAVVARAACEADLLVEVDPEHDAPGQGQA